MTYLRTVSILSATALGLFAVSANAAEMTQNADADSRLVTEAKTAVLASAETSNLIAVSDDQGNVFYNHIVDVNDLPSTELDIEIQETYTYEYNGRTYTNVVVTTS